MNWSSDHYSFYSDKKNVAVRLSIFRIIVIIFPAKHERRRLINYKNLIEWRYRTLERGETSGILGGTSVCQASPSVSKKIHRVRSDGRIHSERRRVPSVNYIDSILTERRRVETKLRKDLRRGDKSGNGINIPGKFPGFNYKVLSLKELYYIKWVRLFLTIIDRRFSNGGEKPLGEHFRSLISSFISTIVVSANLV